MNNNNMTRDPNQQNRPSSIFNFDTYPCPSMNNLTTTTTTTTTPPIDWSCIPLLQQQQQLLDKTTRQFCTNYQPDTKTFGNFIFTTQTPNPVQFPFPTTPTTTKIDGNQYSFGYNVSNLSTIPTTTTTIGRCFKRKTDSPPLSKPIKQHITEEKMAEHMSKLHISSETVRTTDATSSTTTNEIEETEFERTRRLYMCEEMRKLQHDSILPHSILTELQRPCTALVLWQPPKRLLDLDRQEQEEEGEEDNNNNNNNSDNNNNNDINIQMEMDNL